MYSIWNLFFPEFESKVVESGKEGRCGVEKVSEKS